MKKIIITAVVGLLIGGVIGYLAHQTDSQTKGLNLLASNFTNVSTATLQVGTGCDTSYGSCAGMYVVASGALTSSSTIQRGGNYATTTGSAASTTIAASEINYSTIAVTPNLISGFTLTLPASSTLSSFLPTVGDTIEINLLNATSAQAYITVAGGTGSLLQSTASSSRIHQGLAGKFTVIRKANTDLLWILTGN